MKVTFLISVSFITMIVGQINAMAMPAPQVVISQAQPGKIILSMSFSRIIPLCTISVRLFSKKTFINHNYAPRGPHSI